MEVTTTDSSCLLFFVENCGIILIYGEKGGKMNRITLTAAQEKAKNIILNRIYTEEHVSVLKGYAGVGKSVVIANIEEELKSVGYNPHYCAFTGQAAKILIEKGCSATTIHKLIYEPVIVRGELKGFRKKEKEELDTNLIIVDEISMVDSEMWNDLESYRIQLLGVGDDFQLPPVSGNTNKYYGKNHAQLLDVMRQALESKILWAATEIRLGNQVYYGQYGDQLLVDSTSKIDKNWYRPDVKFITGRNQTKDEINEIINEGWKPKKGSKIMFLKNDMSMGIVNGTTVEILEIRKIGYSYHLTFELDGLIIDGYKADYRQPLIKNNQFFDLAYASSNHKMQGSTVSQPLVIIDESYCFPQHRSQWQYVALTRSDGKFPVAWLR